MAILEVSNATKVLGSGENTRTLWDGISMEVNSGDVIGISGTSGSGKSTLLNCLGLLEPLSEGTIKIHGNIAPSSRWGRQKARKQHIGFLFQDFALIDNESAAQNIDVAQPSLKQRRLTADQALEQVGLAGRASSPVSTLSGGEQQRVAVARLLVKNPSLVLADEPTASLDRKNAEVVMEHLFKFARRGAGVVIVSHDHWTLEQCSRVLSLDPH